MPSVGMRRTTRGFGVSKSIDGARVLRSGRRLWPESGDIKLRRHNDVDDWFRLLNSDGNDGRSGRGHLDCKWDQKQKLSSKPLIFVDFQEENVERKIKPMKPAAIAAAASGSRIVRSDRMFGIVYGRKRKRTFSQDHNFSVEGKEEKCYNGNGKFSLRCFRRQRKEKAENVVHTVKKPVLRSSSIRSKSGSRKRQLRNVTSSCGVQTRRSSLRNTKGRNMPLVGLQKASRSLVPRVIRNKKSAPGSFPVALHNKSKRSEDVSSAASSCTLKPAQNVAIAIPSCSANLLVFESDKCYRKEGGAVVKLEISDSGEWVLVVKMDDLTRYIVKAEKVMKPCSCNRFIHNITWSADNTWKLEFPNRRDWLRFKDLYEQCYVRNILHRQPIPVPGVHEVSGYVDDFDYSFSRPDSYISCNSDEVCRALAKRTANYDMDADDEGWLDKLNIEFLAQNELHELVSEDKFESMIDALEKGFYCSADDSLDETDALSLCLDLGRIELIEAVYGYWMKKRKQKKAPLLRVFQGHEPKVRPLIPTPPLRKRRSLKRQPSQVGSDKLPNIWREIAAERHAMELQNAKLRAEEAKKTKTKTKTASKSTELAVRISRAAETSLVASSYFLRSRSQDTSGS